MSRRKLSLKDFVIGEMYVVDIEDKSGIIEYTGVREEHMGLLKTPRIAHTFIFIQRLEGNEDNFPIQGEELTATEEEFNDKKNIMSCRTLTPTEKVLYGRKK